MNTLLITEPWLARLLPRGWPLGTSTLITGPGGSGKPLIGNAVTASWLEAGGSVVFLSLQYPTYEFTAESLRRVAGVDLGDHRGRIAFVELDAEREGMELVAQDRIRANLVDPETWRGTLQAALDLVPGEGPGSLLFGSALNLLLFSPTYGKRLLEEIKRTLTEGDARVVSSLFSVSSSAKKEMISELEEVADNLLVAHSARDPFRLFLQIQRMRGVPFDGAEIEVPFSPDMLEEVKEVAEHSRRRVIPLISSI
jgi:KaiC/GvpD/RAD55 family RecA-like ATPase